MRIPGITAATKIGPDAPTLVSVTDVGTNREFGNGAANVVFTAATTTPSNPAVSYLVTSSSGITATGSSSPIRIQGLGSNENLTFVVRGVNSLGIEGAPSATSSSTLITTVPDKPEIGIASSGNSAAYASFSLFNNGGRAIVEYIVTGSPSGSAVGASSPVTVSGLANGTDYSFSVIAKNANGNSLASNFSNTVRPSAPASGGGGGGGVAPTTTYYCYTSTCETTFGSSQYSVGPTLSYITTSSNNTTNTTNSYFTSITTVVYCNTNQTTAANGAKQTACEGAVIANVITGCTDPNSITFGSCPDSGSFIWSTVTTGDYCDDTYFVEYADQAAWQTYTEYDCAGNVVSSGAGPTCSQRIVLNRSQINGVCGYTRPNTSVASTGNTPSTGGSVALGDGRGYGTNTVPVYGGNTTTTIVTTDIDIVIILLDAYPIEDIELGYNGVTDEWSVTVPVYGGGCFVAGTQVTMADGSFKNMEDLELGDEVRTFDIPGVPDSDHPDDWSPKEKWSIDSTDEFTITTTKVTHKRVGPFPWHYVINNTYKVTYEHYILVKRDSVWQFLQVKDMRIGDLLLKENKEEVTIFDIRHVVETNTVIELDVEDKDYYFADGILAHNLRAPLESSAYK